MVVALVAPNTNQIMRNFEPASNTYVVDAKYAVQMAPGIISRIVWRPGVGSAVPVAVASAAAFLALSSVSEFLYFQF
jgi:hypothetical protein